MSTPERGRVPASMLLRSNRTDDLSVDLKKSKQPPPLRRTDLHTKKPNEGYRTTSEPPERPWASRRRPRARLPWASRSSPRV